MKTKQEMISNEDFDTIFKKLVTGTYTTKSYAFIPSEHQSNEIDMYTMHGVCLGYFIFYRTERGESLFDEGRDVLIEAFSFLGSSRIFTLFPELEQKTFDAIFEFLRKEFENA